MQSDNRAERGRWHTVPQWLVFSVNFLKFLIEGQFFTTLCWCLPYINTNQP